MKSLGCPNKACPRASAGRIIRYASTTPVQGSVVDAERFFNCRNDQDLWRRGDELRADPRLAGAQVLRKASRVEFFVPDFEQFMAVVWMILLHPNVRCTAFPRSSSVK
jgi:hypothetical protein